MHFNYWWSFTYLFGWGGEELIGDRNFKGIPTMQVKKNRLTSTVIIPWMKRVGLMVLDFSLSMLLIIVNWYIICAQVYTQVRDIKLRNSFRNLKGKYVWNFSSLIFFWHTSQNRNNKEQKCNMFICHIEACLSIC